ncbi:MAG: geranylgeranyl reductase family protein [Cyanobacteriota bacterium]|nr:geranylgeranyl reductase family protein [Cyanobacteriota bacterium]
MTALPAQPVDTIILGAGPAGASAAFHLARHGRHVVLFEREERGRGKACGGGMAASVQRWFPFDLSPAVDQVIREVRFTWALEDPVRAVLPGEAPFWIVRRSVLDAFLADRAGEAGADLRFGTEVVAVERQGDLWNVVDQHGQALASRSLLIANGSSSPLPGRLGLGPSRPRFATTLSLEVECPIANPDLARFDFGLVPQGFCWVFPRQRGYSIGVGTFLGAEDLDADAVLRRLLPSLGLSPEAGQRRPTRLRVWDGHHPLDGPGVLVAGDAASLCDPFLAEGLRPALMSGCQAGLALEAWLGGDVQALKRYTATIRRDWGESMGWGKRIAQVFYRFPRVGYQLGIKRPTAPQRIAQILSGEMGYGDIAQRVIRRLLFQRG